MRASVPFPLAVAALVLTQAVMIGTGKALVAIERQNSYMACVAARTADGFKNPDSMCIEALNP